LTYEAIQRPRGWSPLMPFSPGLTFFGFSFFFLRARQSPKTVPSTL
jgi:hypothetical protein